MHIPFVHLVKFKPLVQFSVDHIPHLVVSCLILFALIYAFGYYVIDRFVSITTSCTFAILLHLVYSCFDIASPYGVLLCCYWM